MNKRLILTFLFATAEVFTHILLGLLLAVMTCMAIGAVFSVFKEYTFPIMFSLIIMVGVFAIIVMRFQQLNSEYKEKANELVNILKE